MCEALNVELGQGYEEKDLKYDKLIIMTDADTDGHHITVLLLTLFFRHMEEFLYNGHVYIALAPLYKITDKSNNKTFVWSKKELEEELSTTFKGKEVVVGRFKGLGEFRPV